MRQTGFHIIVCALFVGCSGDDEASGGTSTTVNPTSEASTGGESSGEETGTTEPPPSPGLAELGTLIVLGDSIGDGGGLEPFYYDLLHESLRARYGTIEYINHADGGSETDELIIQTATLPPGLPGPVAIVVTSGGNDMKSNLIPIVAGEDEPLREEMQSNLYDTFRFLLEPGRFEGDAYLFMGNIYDASDGMGDFGDNGCAFGEGYPPIPTDSYFDNWNGAIREVVEDFNQYSVDIHQLFRGHGYHSDANWYHTDCTHPNVTGHDELHKRVYFQITGETL